MCVIFYPYMLAVTLLCIFVLFWFNKFYPVKTGIYKKYSQCGKKISQNGTQVGFEVSCQYENEVIKWTKKFFSSMTILLF
jgi:hypothetical protein